MNDYFRITAKFLRYDSRRLVPSSETFMDCNDDDEEILFYTTYLIIDYSKTHTIGIRYIRLKCWIFVDFNISVL